MQMKIRIVEVHQEDVENTDRLIINYINVAAFWQPYFGLHNVMNYMKKCLNLCFIILRRSVILYNREYLYRRVISNGKKYDKRYDNW